MQIVTNPLGHKEAPMQIVITPKPAGQSGEVAGHQATCPCGLRMTSSLQTLLVQDINAHIAWHAAKGA